MAEEIEIVRDACKIIAEASDAEHVGFMYGIEPNMIVMGDCVKKIHELNLGLTPEGKLIGSPTDCCRLFEGIGLSYLATMKHILGMSNEQFISILARRLSKDPKYLNQPPRTGFRLLHLHEPKEGQ